MESTTYIRDSYSGMDEIEYKSAWSGLDALNEAFFYGQILNQCIREEWSERLAVWLLQACSVSIPRFSPGPALFSGETLHTQFAAHHILLVETAYALLRLAHPSKARQFAMEVFERELEGVCFTSTCLQGECAHATIAWLRYLLAAGRDPEHHFALLASRRDGKGRWNGFPTYYTLYMLAETTHPSALAERRYAAALIHSPQKSRLSETVYRRRCDILEKAFSDLD